MDLQLAGRVVLVTGSWRGTGAGIARVLAAEGATVIVHGLEPGQAAPVAGQINATGARALAVSGDIRTEAGAESAAGEALEAAGRVDALVNNYGAAAGRGWFDGSDAEWLEMYQVNVLSGARMVRHLVPPMRERGWGRVVFLSTVGSRRPRAQTPGYYAAKAGLANMAVSLAKELAGTGITVNTVSPGILGTAEVRERMMQRAQRKGWGSDWKEIERRAATEYMPNFCHRLGAVEEVGSLVAFLVSERAAFINGADLRIDGGAADCV
ncbi:MAG: SDR family NAD(P)-dependent oxidoreductase [Gammaproteobacteria bacterium]